jgi:hypothetical protein
MTRVSTNSHGCFVVTFPVLHIYFLYIYIYQTCIFCNFHEILFGAIGTLFCENIYGLIR